MELYIKESGELQAPPIVFLHGGGVAGWMWDQQADFFKDYHVLIPDLPGHGNSASVPFLSMHDAAQKVLMAISDYVGIEKVTLVGFSLGAQLIVEILSHWPERVESAIIISALVKPMKAKNLLLSTLKMSFGLIKNKGFSRLQAKQLFIPKQYWSTYYEDSLRITKDNFMNMMEANLTYALPSDFSHSDVRTLVLVGTREQEIMKASAADLVKANRNCLGYQITGVGHGLPMISADCTNEITYNFVNNVHMHRNKKLQRIV